MAMYLPQYTIKKTQEYLSSSHLKYTVCRIVFRTPVANLRSDMNGLDLYTSSVLGVDRYDIATSLFDRLKATLI